MHVIKRGYSVQENNPTGICGSFLKCKCIHVCSCKYMSLRCPLKWEGINPGIISSVIEYFGIVLSEGDVYTVYLYCIYMMKMHWLFVQTQSALSTVVSVLIFLQFC